jgi:hypothetical protein
MTKQLKVYGWNGYRAECPSANNGSHQTREIVAAHSVAEVLRIAGISRREFEWNGDETGNTTETTLALTYPGTIFWKPLNGGSHEFRNATTGEQIKASLPDRLRWEAQGRTPFMYKLLIEAAEALEERA